MTELELEEAEEAQMTFLEHLDELRTRLIRSIYPLLPAFIVAWIFRDELLGELSQPLLQACRARGIEVPRLHGLHPLDGFMVRIKVALVVAIIGSSPWLFYQLWAFISPGLYGREKRVVIPFVFASSICFASGAFFGWFIVFPPVFEALLEFYGALPGGMTLEPTFTASDYTSFITRMLLIFGVVFEVPVVITTLAVAGMVNWRQLLSFGRWWVVVAAVLSALLTPQDVISMLMMMGPLVVLYYLSVVLAYMFGERPPPPEVASPDEDDESDEPA